MSRTAPFRVILLALAFAVLYFGLRHGARSSPDIALFGSCILLPWILHWDCVTARKGARNSLRAVAYLSSSALVLTACSILASLSTESVSLDIGQRSTNEIVFTTLYYWLFLGLKVAYFDGFAYFLLTTWITRLIVPGVESALVPARGLAVGILHASWIIYFCVVVPVLLVTIRILQPVPYHSLFVR